MDAFKLFGIFPFQAGLFWNFFFPVLRKRIGCRLLAATSAAAAARISGMRTSLEQCAANVFTWIIPGPDSGGMLKWQVADSSYRARRRKPVCLRENGVALVNRSSALGFALQYRADVDLERKGACVLGDPRPAQAQRGAEAATAATVQGKFGIFRFQTRLFASEIEAPPLNPECIGSCQAPTEYPITVCYARN